jgi:hypothetical protein
MVPILPKPTAEEVLKNITPFFQSEELQGDAAKQLIARLAVVEELKKLKAADKLNPASVAALLQINEHALNTVISLMGISQERLQGIIALKPGMLEGKTSLSINAIRANIKKSLQFSQTMAELFINGRTDPELVDNLPASDLLKFGIATLSLEPDALIESLLRLGLKGRYDAKKGSILEDNIEKVIKATGVKYVRGETRLPNLSRDVDFVIPSVEDPYLLIESGLFETTARELSDKGRSELLLKGEVEKNYPNVALVRVADGVGWIRRGGQDLKQLIDASHYFFVDKTLADLATVIHLQVPEKYFSPPTPVEKAAAEIAKKMLPTSQKT